jgi:D-glycero-D-manno-heptose 1,7-bisphosphate phosphatase
VLYDRDGTLVVDVPYNGDPSRVRPLPTVKAGLERLRHQGIPTAVVTNQSGVARGLLSAADVARVNAQVVAQLGPVGPFLVCPHGPADDCPCRKPRPGLLLRAASELGVTPERCAVIGDVGSDVEAALAAGARPVLVPTSMTRADEVTAAPETAPDFLSAVVRLLGPS